jgi:hypothetical protein
VNGFWAALGLAGAVTLAVVVKSFLYRPGA